MPTVIDSLLIELGLDASKFDQAQKKSVEELRKFGQANDKASKNAQKQTKDLAEGFTKVRNSIIGIGVAIVGVNGFKDFVANMVTGNAALGRTASLLNTTERDLDAWHHQVEKFGGTGATFDASMQHIVGGLQKFKMGMGGEDVVSALARLGVQAKNGAVDLYELADALKRVKDREGIQAALSLSEQLGLDQASFQMLVQGSAAVRRLHDEMVKQSGASRQNSKDAQELQGKWAALKQEVSGLGQAIFHELVPALNAAADALLKLFGATDRSKGIESLRKGDWWSASFQLPAKDFAKALALKASGQDGGTQLSNAQIADYLAGNQPAAVAASPSANMGGNLPRGMRNNNPGNIRMGKFAQAHGATGADKDGFAVFPSMAAGEKAMSDLLQSYRGQGVDTISGIVSKWAPSSENDTSAYIRDVSAKTGIGATQHLDLSQYAAVQRAIAMHENGPAYGKASTVETNIAKIEVHTAATDAHGVARDMHQALQNNALITAGMVGMN